MLFLDLRNALADLENPRAAKRYQDKLTAKEHSDTALRETFQEIDDRVRKLRNMVEAIRSTTRASVDSGNFELRMVTQVEAPTEYSKSEGSSRHTNSPEWNDDSVEVGTILPCVTPTKIKTEPSSPMGLIKEEQASLDDEDQSDIRSRAMRSANPSLSEVKVKQEPQDRSPDSSSFTGNKSAREQRYRKREIKVERQNVKDTSRSAKSSSPPGDDTQLAGLLEDVKLGKKKK